MMMVMINFKTFVFSLRVLTSFNPLTSLDVNSRGEACRCVANLSVNPDMHQVLIKEGNKYFNTLLHFEVTC